MDFQQSGQGHFLGGSPASTSGGTSLAVRQFCAVAFGWQPVHPPSQPWRVERVTAEQKYCLKCVGPRTFDVVSGGRHTAAVCRSCGEEVNCVE